MVSEAGRAPLLSSSKRKVLAAYVKARGNALVAAEIAGVSRQYVYEVLASLRSRGIRLRAYPSLAALGRVFLVFLPEEKFPRSDLTAARLAVYTVSGCREEAAVYVIPREAGLKAGLPLPPGSRAHELLDVIPAAPLTEIQRLRPKAEGLPTPELATLDEDDKAIMLALYEDLTKPLAKALPTVGKSRLSYHYRRHVKPLLRILPDYNPRGFHSKPLLLARVKASSEEWIAAMAEAEEAYLLMPETSRLSAFALLEVDDTFTFLKSLASARRAGLDLRVTVLGYIDPYESEGFYLPPAFFQVKRVS